MQSSRQTPFCSPAGSVFSSPEGSTWSWVSCYHAQSPGPCSPASCRTTPPPFSPMLQQGAAFPGSVSPTSPGTQGSPGTHQAMKRKSIWAKSPWTTDMLSLGFQRYSRPTTLSAAPTGVFLRAENTPQLCTFNIFFNQKHF